MHVLDVTHDLDVGGEPGLVVLDVESDADVTGCPDCGVVAVGHGRHVQVLHDAPCFGTPVRVRWRKRIWRCPNPRVVEGPGPRRTASRRHGAKLTSRVAEWAVSLLRLDETTVSAIARRLGVNWHTCWNAVRKHAETSIDINKRASGVKTSRVDEHIWRPSRISSADKAVTVMVDLTRGPDRRLCARLLDAVQGRSGTAYADWLKEQGSRSPCRSNTPRWTRSAGIAMPDPRGRQARPDATPVAH